MSRHLYEDSLAVAAVIAHVYDTDYYSALHI